MSMFISMFSNVLWVEEDHISHFISELNRANKFSHLQFNLNVIMLKISHSNRRVRFKVRANNN